MMTRPNPDILALPAQVLRTYKRLVQYIHSQRLDVGDRLPSQEDLRRELGKNHYTLSTAMRALSAQGVLARKTSIGTVLCDRDAIGAVPWSIGVATIEAQVEGELSVFANLAMRVQTRLNKAGCRCLSYSRPVNNEPTRLHHFGLLANDLQEGVLDALVLLTPLASTEWQQLNRQGIPVLHVPFWESAPNGVIIDQAAFVRQALRRLAAAGCKSFGLVAATKPEESPRPRYLDGLEKGLIELALPSESVTCLDGRFGRAGGARAADMLLARHHADRPDGLLFLDNYTAAACTDSLSQGDAYRPEIAVLGHRQLPLPYSLPVHHFAIDLEDLVDRTIRHLFTYLYQPHLPNTQVLLAAAYEAESSDAPTPIRRLT